MTRRVRWVSVAAVALASLAPAGCHVEAEPYDAKLQIDGTVTYNGRPVRKGAVHFLPTDPSAPSASGTVADGRITGVSTRQPGDGIRPGSYRIAITSFDEAFEASAAKRDASGPDPVEVARGVDRLKPQIPLRYGNARESGLTADLSAENHSLRIVLVD